MIKAGTMKALPVDLVFGIPNATSTQNNQRDKITLCQTQVGKNQKWQRALKTKKNITNF